MGIIKQGILGGFLGKVGGVVGGNFKGIATMRAMPLSVANPRTASQVRNRIRFQQVTELANFIGLSFIRNYWNRFAVKMSGYNLFTSVNKSAFNESGEFVPSLLVVSNGSIAAPILESIEVSGSTDTFNATMSYQITGERLATDVVNIVFVPEGGGAAFVSDDIDATETDVTFPLPADFCTLGLDLYIFAVSRRADGSKVSNTGYYQTQPVA